MVLSVVKTTIKYNRYAQIAFNLYRAYICLRMALLHLFSYFYLSYNSLSVPTFLLISIPKTNSSRKENESRHICQDKLNYAMVTNDSKNIGGFKQGIISC